jgi:hypothetical protein
VKNVLTGAADLAAADVGAAAGAAVADLSVVEEGAAADVATTHDRA